MSGFSPPTAVQDQAVLDSTNAAAIGSAIGQMKWNDALSGLSGLAALNTTNDVANRRTIGETENLACSGKTILREQDYTLHFDESSRQYMFTVDDNFKFTKSQLKQMCYGQCSNDESCKFATVTTGTFTTPNNTQTLLCVHSTGDVNRDSCNTGGKDFMLTKRRFWRDEQKMKCGFSTDFSTIRSPNRVLTPLKSASKIRISSFVHPSKIFVWEG
jgi:hypothetical protein